MWRAGSGLKPTSKSDCSTMHGASFQSNVASCNVQSCPISDVSGHIHISNMVYGASCNVKTTERELQNKTRACARQ